MEGVEISALISSVSILRVLGAQYVKNCFLSKVCIWNVTLSFLFVTNVAVNLLRTGSKLCFHSHPVANRLVSSSGGSHPSQGLAAGSRSAWVTLPSAVSHRNMLGNGGTKRAGVTPWFLTWRMTSRKHAYSQQNPNTQKCTTQLEVSPFHNRVTCKHYSICMRQKKAFPSLNTRR